MSQNDTSIYASYILCLYCGETCSYCNFISHMDNCTYKTEDIVDYPKYFFSIITRLSHQQSISDIVDEYNSDVINILGWSDNTTLDCSLRESYKNENVKNINEVLENIETNQKNGLENEQYIDLTHNTKYVKRIASALRSACKNEINNAIIFSFEY